MAVKLTRIKWAIWLEYTEDLFFRSPDRSSGRAIALSLVGVCVSISKMLKIYIKVFYVIGKALASYPVPVTRLLISAAKHKNNNTRVSDKMG